MSKRIVQALFFALAVAFIAIGFFNGEARLVFLRAVNICLECIGIG